MPPKFIVAPGGIGCPGCGCGWPPIAGFMLTPFGITPLVRYVDGGRCIPGCMLLGGIPFGRRFIGGCCCGGWGGCDG